MTSIWIDSTQGSLTRWTAIEVGLYLDSAGRILVDVTVLLQQHSPGAAAGAGRNAAFVSHRQDGTISIVN